MAPAATLRFDGFPGIPSGSAFLAAEGDPPGAARQLKELHPGSTVHSLPRGFLPLGASAPGAAPEASVCGYLYELRLVRRRGASVWIACWRRYPAGLGWQRRCGPMPLPRFLDRFLDAPSGPFNRSAGRAPA